jgi:hypothetical protein
MNNSRKARGARTQRLIALRWKLGGMFPNATSTGAGESGSDIRNTPGLAVEIKGTKEGLSLQAALRQAKAGAVARGEPDAMPILIWRHNGQGEVNIASWTVTMSLADFEELWRHRTHRVTSTPESRGCRGGLFVPVEDDDGNISW